MKTAEFATSGARAPINTIFCIGRNYVRHAEELGHKVEDTPVVFLKPISSLIFEGEHIELPGFSTNVHFETELVALVGRGGKDIPRDEAMSHIAGYAAGLDLTARDVQDRLKEKGLPWTISKGFDTSACLSKFLTAAEIGNPRAARFSLTVNGILRQSGNPALMVFPLDELVSYLSTVFTLSEGDLIFTGTPEGVAPLTAGDRLEISLMDRVRAGFNVRARL